LTCTVETNGYEHMKAPGSSLDKIDRLILELLQKDCRIALQTIAKRAGTPKSTIHYRIKRLEQEGIVEGYYAKLNAARMRNDYMAVVFVKSKYGPKYHERIGQKLTQIPGVWAVYYVLGELDFIVLIRATDREDYMSKLEKMSAMREIERTSTQVVGKVIKEDPRLPV